jgi:hypothetical protein
MSQRTYSQYLQEGEYVKSIDTRLVNKIIKMFIKPKIKNAPKSDKTDDMEIEIDFYKVREYLEYFINALIKQGEFSSGQQLYKQKKSAKDVEEYGTAVWVINLMNAIGYPTTPSANIAKFEKELTTFVKKIM